MKHTLLIEIGVEELPVSFVFLAIQEMPLAVKEALHRLRLDHGQIHAMGTPRRLAIIVKEVAESQRDLEEEVIGPPKSAAFDAKGEPTRAAHGFAQKHGKTTSDLYVIRNERGEYVALRRVEKGRKAIEVLPEVVYAAARIAFPKSMRWSSLDFYFGRPIQWLVALLGDEVIDVTLAERKAEAWSRGHRFLAQDRVWIGHAENYVDALRRAHVIVDVEERRRLLKQELEAKAQALGLFAEEDPELIDANVMLVEKPHVLIGHFDELFLSLPEEVIVSVMRGHQRYIPLREAKSGKLAPRYAIVANTAGDPEEITRGNDRVLRARLKDARFFVEEDLKVPLRARVQELSGIVFHSQLGSMLDKVHRMGELAQSFVENSQVRELAALTKVDLLTLIVREFPELHGVMGRHYARAQGESNEEAQAIFEHCLPRTASDLVPRSASGAALALADRLDTLVGCLGIGLLPTGSADPFALRRAAIGAIRIALEGPIDWDLRRSFDAAYAIYSRQGWKLDDSEAVWKRFEEFLRGRLKSHLSESSPSDIVVACLSAWPSTSIRDFLLRVQALSKMRSTGELDSLGVVYRRAHHIVEDARKAFQANGVNPAFFKEEAEWMLYKGFADVEDAISASLQHKNYEEALSLVGLKLYPALDRFFAEVFVMVDDHVLRNNRLKLLSRIVEVLGQIAHFHLIGR
ncbi:MAG: glycine--tRNA ligase subunit beta [Sandaracinaceae bacterium]|nr:glycine--tRNA ligase subunit beta [Sandaracinaceae bacterium]